MTTSWTSKIREFQDVLSPVSMHQFLAVQQWTLHSQASFMETWIQSQDGRPVHVVHLPRDRESVDYERRLAEAARDVAKVFDWSLTELAGQVASVRADLFYVRVRGSASDGTIPLHRASATIDAIEKMVKSAAILTNNPRASGVGRTSERVTTFLQDSLRMGHTRRGSFIITVAARLDDDSLDDGVAGQRVVETGTEPPAASELNFTRRVMSTLSRSLAVTEQHLTGDDPLAFENAADRGMVAPIVEALGEIGVTPDGPSGIDLNFEWSPVLSQEAEVPSAMSFPRSAVEKIPATVERLRRRNDAREEVAVVGPVVSLTREAADEADAGEVIVLADIGGVTRRVALELTGVSYDWAIYAHQRHLPFSASGVLGKVGNRWRVVESLSVDTTFLQQWQARRLAERTGEPMPESETGESSGQNGPLPE